MTTPPKTDWKRLAKMKDIDTRDIPELDNAFFQNAELREAVNNPDKHNKQKNLLAVLAEFSDDFMADGREQPDSWDAFFDLLDSSDVPDDFLSERDNDPPQERDLF